MNIIKNISSKVIGINGKLVLPDEEIKVNEDVAHSAPVLALERVKHITITKEAPKAETICEDEADAEVKAASKRTKKAKEVEE